MKNRSFTDGQLQAGLDHFDPEERIFPRIAARNYPSLTDEELLVVLKWKLGRVKHSDTDILPHRDEVNGAIRLAGEDGKEVEAIRLLCGVKGIKLAVASAILTVCHPGKFTIIDVRVLEVLGLEPSRAEGWTPERYWHEFVPAVRRHCRPGFSLRDVDKALWGLSVRGRIKEILGQGGCR